MNTVYHTPTPFSIPQKPTPRHTSCEAGGFISFQITFNLFLRLQPREELKIRHEEVGGVEQLLFQLTEE